MSAFYNDAGVCVAVRRSDAVEVAEALDGWQVVLVRRRIVGAGDEIEVREVLWTVDTLERARELQGRVGREFR